MLSHSILLYIYLLFNFNILCYGEQNYQSVASLSTNSIISPDRYENDETFAVADFKIIGSRNNYQIDLRIQNLQNQISRECSFNITTISSVTKVGGITLRRLKGSNGGSSKVVLAWYDEVDEPVSGHRYRAQIVAMNLDNCQSKDLGLESLVRNPIIIPVGSGGFDVYLADPENCKQVGERCKIYYNANFLNFGGPSKFEIDLDWSTLKLEPFYGSMLAHGLDSRNTYRVQVFDYNTWPKTIMSWENADPQMQVVLSSYSVCWVANPNIDKTVNCSQFRHDGKVTYTNVITFDFAVTPIAVRFVDNDELFLLVGETSCSSEKNCWNLKWTRVFKDSVASGTEEFACTGDRKNLVISDITKSNGKLGYWYACRH